MLEYVALRTQGLSFAKTPAGFKISKIPKRRVTCYLDEFRRRTLLLRSTGPVPAHTVLVKQQKRPSLNAEPISRLIQGSSDQEQALYVLLAPTGMRVSEGLAVETRHFIKSGRTIVVEQQVEKNVARIVQYLKTGAAWREVDLHPDIAEYLRRYMTGKRGLNVGEMVFLVRQMPLRHSLPSGHLQDSARNAVYLAWCRASIGG